MPALDLRLRTLGRLARQPGTLVTQPCQPGQPRPHVGLQALYCVVQLRGSAMVGWDARRG